MWASSCKNLSKVWWIIIENIFYRWKMEVLKMEIKSNKTSWIKFSFETTTLSFNFRNQPLFEYPFIVLKLLLYSYWNLLPLTFTALSIILITAVKVNTNNYWRCFTILNNRLSNKRNIYSFEFKIKMLYNLKIVFWYQSLDDILKLL